MGSATVRNPITDVKQWGGLPARRGLVSSPELVCEDSQRDQCSRCKDDLGRRGKRRLQIEVRFVAAGSAVAMIGYPDVVFGDAIEVTAYRPLEPAYRARLRLTVRDVARQSRRRGRKRAFVGLL